MDPHTFGWTWDVISESRPWTRCLTHCQWIPGELKQQLLANEPKAPPIHCQNHQRAICVRVVFLRKSARLPQLFRYIFHTRTPHPDGKSSRSNRSCIKTMTWSHIGDLAFVCRRFATARFELLIIVSVVAPFVCHSQTIQLLWRWFADLLYGSRFSGGVLVVAELLTSFEIRAQF